MQADNVLRYIYIHTLGRFNAHKAHIAQEISLMNIGNNAPRVGFERTPLVSQAALQMIRLARLPDVITLSMPTCLCGSLPER